MECVFAKAILQLQNVNAILDGMVIIVHVKMMMTCALIKELELYVLIEENANVHLRAKNVNVMLDLLVNIAKKIT